MQVYVNYKLGMQCHHINFYLIIKNLILIMSESISQFIPDNNKWKNIEYDFSGHSNNCTLNVHIYYLVINNFLC